MNQVITKFKQQFPQLSKLEVGQLLTVMERLLTQLLVKKSFAAQMDLGMEL
jgi:predicted lysophospholipase L1 biosynthesis ABC-type transport system permease subunit